MIKKTLVLPLILALAGCASTTTAPTDAESDLSERGNAVVQIGETVEHDGATMAISGATMDPACTESYSRPPDNGHFLVLDVTAATGSDPLASPLNRFSMSWIDADGMTTPGLGIGGPSGFCLAANRYFPSPLGAGETGAGVIVLDVESAAGILVYKPHEEWEPGFEWVISATG